MQSAKWKQKEGARGERFFVRGHEWVGGLVEFQHQDLKSSKWRSRNRLVWGLFWIGITVAMVIAAVFLPPFPVVIGATMFTVGFLSVQLKEVTAPIFHRQQSTQSPAQQPDEATEQQQEDEPSEQVEEVEVSTKLENPNFRRYRKLELERVVASLKANSPILVIGEEGSGKSVLTNAVTETLIDEGYRVIEVEITTPKYILKGIADQLGVPTVEDPLDPKTRVLTLDQLKKRLEAHFEEMRRNKEPVFLIIDDAHRCDLKIREWLKTLKRQGMPMFLTATSPPRSDIFLNLPRIELAPLPDYCIREIMEQVAMERGLPLQPNALANLQQRAGGNPMLAQKAVNEEYLGIDNEAGDHKHYFDTSPLLMLIGITFMASKFLARGFNDPSLYIIFSIASAVFMGLSRLFYGLPKESRRIE